MSDPTQPPAGDDPFAPPPAGGAPVPPPPPAYGSTPPAPPAPSAYTPAPVPNYGAPAAVPQNGPGTTALVCGIIGLFVCGIILGIVAIIQGRKGKELAAQGLATNGSSAQAGFILGIVGIALNVVGILFYVFVFAAASTSSGVGG